MWNICETHVLVFKNFGKCKWNEIQLIFAYIVLSGFKRRLENATEVLDSQSKKRN